VQQKNELQKRRVLPQLASDHVVWREVDSAAELVNALQKKSVQYMSSEVFFLGSGRCGGARVTPDMALYSGVAVTRGGVTTFLRARQIFTKKAKKSADFIVLGFTVTMDKVCIFRWQQTDSRGFHFLLS
jgi:hypothetical protein